MNTHLGVAISAGRTRALAPRFERFLPPRSSRRPRCCDGNGRTTVLVGENGQGKTNLLAARLQRSIRQTHRVASRAEDGRTDRVNLDEFARLGTAISGLTTAFGFVLAWRGFNGWRHQKRAEHQAEAARKAYSALTRACDALEQYAQRPYIHGPDLQPNRERAASIRKLMDDRHREVAPALAELRDAEELAVLYLGAPYDMLFSWATALEGTVRKSAARWLLHVSDGEEEEAAVAFEEAFGARVQKSISDLHRQAKHALRPVARYHGSPLVRWVVSSRIDFIIRGIDHSRVRAIAETSDAQRSTRSTAA